MDHEINTTMDINNIEFDVRINLDYTPASIGSDVEPPSDEVITILELHLLSEDENGHEVATDVSVLLDDETFNESVVELVKHERV